MRIENAIAVALKDNDLVPVLLSQFPPPAGRALPVEQAVSQAVLGGGSRRGLRLEVRGLWRVQSSRQGQVTGQMGGRSWR